MHPSVDKETPQRARTQTSRLGGVVGLNKHKLQQRNLPSEQLLNKHDSTHVSKSRFHNRTGSFHKQSELLPLSLNFGQRSHSSIRAQLDSSQVELTDSSRPNYRIASGSHVSSRHVVDESRRPTSDALSDDSLKSAVMSKTRLQCFKTKLCHFFLQQKCSRGSYCVFAHSASELRLTPDLSKTKLCVKWKRGVCFSDANLCNYAHGEVELKPSADGNFDTSYTDDFGHPSDVQNQNSVDVDRMESGPVDEMNCKVGIIPESYQQGDSQCDSDIYPKPSDEGIQHMVLEATSQVKNSSKDTSVNDKEHSKFRSTGSTPTEKSKGDISLSQMNTQQTFASTEYLSFDQPLSLEVRTPPPILSLMHAANMRINQHIAPSMVTIEKSTRAHEQSLTRKDFSGFEKHLSNCTHYERQASSSKSSDHDSSKKSISLNPSESDAGGPSDENQCQAIPTSSHLIQPAQQPVLVIHQPSLQQQRQTMLVHYSSVQPRQALQPSYYAMNVPLSSQMFSYPVPDPTLQTVNPGISEGSVLPQTLMQSSPTMPTSSEAPYFTPDVNQPGISGTVTASRSFPSQQVSTCMPAGVSAHYIYHNGYLVPVVFAGKSNFSSAPSRETVQQSGVDQVLN